MSEIERVYDGEIMDTSPYLEVSATHLSFSDDTPYEVWEAAFGKINEGRKRVMWWIGDALRFGEHRYGEKYSQALEETEYEYKTLANARYVAERVESSRRRENLPFSHHAEVAALPPDQQERWLSEAEPEPGEARPKLSVARLRERIRDEKRGDLGETAPALKAGDLSYPELEKNAEATLRRERAEHAMRENGLVLEAVPIEEAPPGPPDSVARKREDEHKTVYEAYAESKTPPPKLPPKSTPPGVAAGYDSIRYFRALTKHDPKEAASAHDNRLDPDTVRDEIARAEGAVRWLETYIGELRAKMRLSVVKREDHAR